ncbi:DUF4065 domain-containing protein [bacterium]|nr:DUF4065 domain-containing protein [bacterium]
MKYKFKEEKTTQAVAKLLELNGGRMNYMKLIKLLYLIDREALISWGYSISFDNYCSMDRGPILSTTYSLIIEEKKPGHNSYWTDHISEPAHYEVHVKKNPSVGRLSEAELDLITRISVEYYDKNQWDMVDIVHGLPEWENPNGSSLPIPIERILEHGKYTPKEIYEVRQTMDASSFLEELK